MVVYNIYGVPPPPPEEHHEAIDSLNTIIQWIQTQSLKMEGRVQANSFLTSSNSAVVVQLSQMTVTMNEIQAPLKNLYTTSTNPKMTERKFYCSRCGSNLIHGNKTCSSNKTGHK